MFVKNTMEAAGQDSNLLITNNLGKSGSTDGNLHFDQTIYNKKTKTLKKSQKQLIRTDSFSTVKSSDDSDLSDDTFL